MLKVGLTGGIGSGKTLVSSVFKQLGVSVYNADTEAKRLMETDPDIAQLIQRLLGRESYKNGKLNRKFISDVVFSDEAILKSLNSIVHPAVHRDFDKWVLDKVSEPYVIKEAAILFEAGGAETVNYTVFVKANMNTRIDRVVERDHVTAEQVRSRMDHQMDDQEKEKLADYIINNEIGSMILPQIVDLHNKFLKLIR
jgi:dephospho-CoA kinase